MRIRSFDDSVTDLVLLVMDLANGFACELIAVAQHVVNVRKVTINSVKSEDSETN